MKRGKERIKRVTTVPGIGVRAVPWCARGVDRQSGTGRRIVKTVWVRAAGREGSGREP
jgi:hypothetical protein